MDNTIQTHQIWYVTPPKLYPNHMTSHLMSCDKR